MLKTMDLISTVSNAIASRIIASLKPNRHRRSYRREANFFIPSAFSSNSAHRSYLFPISLYFIRLLLHFVIIYSFISFLCVFFCSFDLFRKQVTRIINYIGFYEYKSQSLYVNGNLLVNINNIIHSFVGITK